MAYTPIFQVAQKLQTTVEALLEFVDEGLVAPLEKNGQSFISAQDIYRLRFILYLQRQHCFDLAKIKRILETHRPPYSTWRAELNSKVH